jgi:hypothetical protein
MFAFAAWQADSVPCRDGPSAAPAPWPDGHVRVKIAAAFFTDLVKIGIPVYAVEDSDDHSRVADDSVLRLDTRRWAYSCRGTCLRRFGWRRPRPTSWRVRRYWSAALNGQSAGGCLRISAVKQGILVC